MKTKVSTLTTTNTIIQATFIAHLPAVNWLKAYMSGRQVDHCYTWTIVANRVKDRWVIVAVGE